uniref:Clathrin heavy chain n=1 Tax=Panagrolaimus sp. ES5 TaxID=591445 RepID=A0AC34GKM2_9BILA
MVELDQMYVEEKQLGLNLCTKPAVFGSQNKIVFIVADKNIIAFNAKNGKRLAILKYPEPQLALLVLEN